jgi:O-antigen ligase
MAMGVALAAGLIALAGPVGTRLLVAVASFLVFVLGLTGSRGGALALVAGAAALLALTSDRRRVTSALAAAVAVGGVAWTVVQWRGAEGAALATLACACLVAGWAALAIRTRVDRPLLGSGAGSFFLDWREHRTIDLDVRDAHSLYVEALTELGPLGLLLVLALVAVPLVVAVRRRGDPVAAIAAGAFAVFAAHAGIDWDWEMPVVTLAGLGCAGVVVARLKHATSMEEGRGGGRHDR